MPTILGIELSTTDDAVQRAASLFELDDAETVEVTLSNAANVRLMDSSNHASYRNGGQHQYFGGHVRQSHYRLSLPRPGHWHVAIDRGERT